MELRNIVKAKGYATPENALRKLKKVLGDREAEYPANYVIAVNDEGRYVPCVLDTKKGWWGLIHEGITVIG